MSRNLRTAILSGVVLLASAAAEPAIQPHAPHATAAAPVAPLTQSDTICLAVTNGTATQEVTNAAATPLGATYYTSKDGRVQIVTPGSIFYGVALTAPSASFVASVTQDNDSSSGYRFPAFALAENAQGTMSIAVDDDATCTSLPAITWWYSSDQATMTACARVTGAVAGEPLVMLVKLTPTSIVGWPTPLAPVVTYTFSAAVDGTAVPGSAVSVPLEPQS